MFTVGCHYELKSSILDKDDDLFLSGSMICSSGDSRSMGAIMIRYSTTAWHI